LVALLLAAQNVLQKAHHILPVMHTSGCTLAYSAGTSAACGDQTGEACSLSIGLQDKNSMLLP
jgi:hypothetical protein